jgi:DNA-binding NarL/FixJ family response regulator
VSAELKIRVLLADDHELVRGGLRMVLEAESDIDVVSEAGDGAQALELAIQGNIDLAILDVSMPRMSGLQAAEEIRRRCPGLRTLMLSMHENEQYFFEALKAGASGYVLKTAANRDLVDACRASMRGESFLYPPAVAVLIRDYLDALARGETPAADPLSPREREVVTLIAEGLTSEEIAQRLVLSPKTVERHRTNILGKLSLRNRVELTRYAIRRGLVEP